MKTNSIFDEITDLVRREEVCLFVGSGCSIASNAPSASEFGRTLSSLLSNSLQDEVRGKSLPEIAETLILANNSNRDNLNSALCIHFTNLNPNEFHKTLTKIPQIKTIITTNYDALIEKAYWQDYFQVMCSNNDIIHYNSNNVRLYKIHGDCEHLEDIVISNTDYREFLDKPKQQLIWNLVLHELSTKSILFVGYSLEDWNVLNLIDKIRSQIIPRSMYLVSPELTETQQSRLKLYDMKYIRCTGKDLLDEILLRLKHSFGDDVYNNITSNDTLNRFALLNDVIPTFENEGIHTNLKSYKSATPDPMSLKLNFSTKDPDLKLRRESITFKDLIDGFEIPAIKLKDEELSSFEILANGLKINSKDNTKDVILAPMIENVQLGFISHTLGINLKKTAKKYCSDGKVICCLNTPVFNAEFVFNPTSEPLNCQINVRVNDSFTNIEDGILWIKTLIGILESPDMQIWINHLKIGTLSDIKGHECLEAYKIWLDYCQNLKEIEQLSGALFEKYEGFSIQSYEFSKIIKAYLAQTEYIDKPNIRNKKFTLNIPKGSGFSPENKYVMRTVTEISEPIILCGNKFIVPEERLLMLECKIRLLDNKNTEYDTWEVENISDTVQYEVSDYITLNVPPRAFSNVPLQIWSLSVRQSYYYF